MEFKNGTSVYTLDGKQAGSLDRVVINPETMEITHVVVQKGLLSTEDKVVPMEKVDSASHEQIALTCTIDELKLMSPLEIKQYEPKSQGENFDHMGGGIYSSPASDPYVLKETIRTIPQDLVALKEGARVLSDDDKHVGNIEQVFAESGKITHFIASHGVLLKTRRAIPIEWVQILSDEEIKLTVPAQQIDDLPKDQV
jgi:uncharacterized protein YrrD